MTPFNRAIAEGTLVPLKAARADARFAGFSAVHRRDHGLSKGAELTHGNIVAAILQAEAWFTPALKRSATSSRTNSIAALPLYHIFALTLCLLAIRWGSHLTLIPNPRDFGKFIEVLKKRPFHLFPAVNTLFNALLQHPQFKIGRFFAAVPVAGRRHGGFGGHGAPMATGDRLPDGGGLGHERDLRDRHQQYRDRPRVHRHHRPAASRHRHRHQG